MRQRAEKKKKKGGRKTYRVSLYIGFMPGSSTPVASLCVEEGGRPCVEIMGGTGVGDARDVGAASRGRHQDLVTASLPWLLAKRERGHARIVFGCVLRVCTNAQDWEEKKKKKRKTKKEKKKRKRKTDSL